MAQVDIILPCYNRAHIFAKALASIRDQRFTDWRLIVVDDGGTDNTREAIEAFAATVSQPVEYLYRENGGPGLARNTGIARIEAPLVAFLDSDDYWLPHHLADCVRGLQDAPEVDWLFAADRRQTLDGEEVVVEDTFRPEGKPHVFLDLATYRRGPVFVVDDPGTMECAIYHGPFGGLKTSLFRAHVFEKVIMPSFRIGEDYVFSLQVIGEGFKLGYLDQINTVYQLHDGHISNADRSVGVAKESQCHEEYCRAIGSMVDSPLLNPAQRRELRRRLFNERFWTLGYGVYWLGGWWREALGLMGCSIRSNPGEFVAWKTYLTCRAKYALGMAPRRAVAEP